MSSNWSSTCSYLTSTKPVWTPQGRAKDVLKVIVYQFLFDWHNTFLNTPLGVQKMSSKWSSTSSYLCVTKPIWTPHGRPKDVINVIVYQFLFEWHNTCLNTPWTSKRCPQSDRIPVPIWLTQHLLEHPMDVQVMSSKRSSTSFYLSVPTLFEHPMDVQKMSSKWSSTSSYLTDTTPAWTPRGRPNDVLKGIILQVHIWVSQPYLNTPCTCKRCPQSDRLPVPIWLRQHLLENPMDVQKMSSKWSSTSSYLSDPVLFGHPLDVQKMSSKWSSTNSYLCVTKPIWTPHGRPKDVINVIVYQFLFEWHKTCLNTPWTSKRCPQWSSTSSYLAEPTLFEHPKDVRKMFSKWSSTSSYLIDTKPVWTPHGRPKDVLKVIVYQFQFDWHKTCLNTPWTSKRCPQTDRLPVPIWLTHHLLEHPMDVQKMFSKWSSTSSHLTAITPAWEPHGRPKDVLKMVVYLFLFD